MKGYVKSMTLIRIDVSVKGAAARSASCHACTPHNYEQQEIRSVEHGICPHNFGDSAVNKSKIPIFYIVHALNGHISTSGQKSDVTIVFPDPCFL